MENATESQTPDRSNVKRKFGPAHVLHPPADQRHTHTIVMLHGRDTDAEDFAEELMSSTLSDGRSLQDALPGWRWVFPSSQELWSTTFQEFMPAWFEAHSLTDIKARQDLQMEGIRASVEYIQGVLDEEIVRLDGQNDKVIFGGISQGGAVGLWTLLCQVDPKMLPRAFVGASTWIPFDEDVYSILSSTHESNQLASPSSNDDFVKTMLASRLRLVRDGQPLPQVPVSLGHGVDDAYVDVDLGKNAKKILSKAGFEVEWKEYSGAEQEGHWFQVPNQMDDILEFLLRMGKIRIMDQAIST